MNENRSDRNRFLIVITVLGLFPLVASFVPGPLNWGFHFLGYLSFELRIVYLLAFALIVWHAVGKRESRLFHWISAAIESSPKTFLAGAIGLFIIGAVLFRVRAPLLGDGFYILKNFTEAARGSSPLFLRDEPLSTYFFSLVTRLSGIASYADFMRSYLIADILLGIGFIVNVYFIVKTLYAGSRERAAAFSILLSVSSLQLFFGYVETYPAVLFALSLYVNVSVKAIHGKWSSAFVPPLFLLLVSTHYLNVFFAGSFLWFFLREIRAGRTRTVLISSALSVLALLGYLFISGSDLSVLTSFVPYSHFLSLNVPPEEMDRYTQAYTLLSPFHLVDLLNLTFLLASGAVALLCFGSANRPSSAGSGVSPFLFWGSVPVILFLCVVKFDLGAARDWDVFSPMAFPVALFAADRFLRNGDPGRPRFAFAIGTASMMLTLTFLLVNADPAASVSRFRSLFDDRTLSQNGWYGATLQLSMYDHETGNTSDPALLWRSYNERFTDDPRGYENILNNLTGPGKDTSALGVSERWLLRFPDSRPARERVRAISIERGNTLFAGGRLDEAAACYRRAIEIDSADPKALNNLGSVLAEQGKPDSAADMFRKALAIDSTYSDAASNLTRVLSEAGRKRR